MAGLVIVIFLVIGIVTRFEWSDYKRYNPKQEEGVYRVTFDRFLEIFEESGDYIRLNEHCASYSNGWKLSFVFSFTYGDWRKYQKWYKDRKKAEADEKNDYFLKQCNEEFEKNKEDTK